MKRGWVVMTVSFTAVGVTILTLVPCPPWSRHKYHAIGRARQLNSYGVISHTVPTPPVPKTNAVPYIFPLASKITAPVGSAPLPELPNW